MAQHLLVAGGGIAGLAAALAFTQRGGSAQVLEQSGEFSEAGAGLQLGPNATRRLRDWGLLRDSPLRPCEPPRLSVRDAIDGRELGALALGRDASDRYGSPYLTAHRADLHAAMREAASAAGATLTPAARVMGVATGDHGVTARLANGHTVEADALAVADGVWSALRQDLLGDGPAPATGHVALRALVPPAQWPERLRTPDVQAWLGPRLHLVRYPVREGEAVNVVAFLEGHAEAGWDQATGAEALVQAAQGLCTELRDLVQAVPAWRLWPVHDREPLRSARAMAQGRIALMGDAAHPMRPYLAQGAGMAIEDADVLARCLSETRNVEQALTTYAEQRWARCARVQARSRRNGWIFHADGPLRLGRNLAMRIGGERLLDLPWLYSG